MDINTSHLHSGILCKYEDGTPIGITLTNVSQFYKLTKKMNSLHIYSKMFFSSSPNLNHISCIWLSVFLACKHALYCVPAVNNVYAAYDVILPCLIPKSTNPSAFAF